MVLKWRSRRKAEKNYCALGQEDLVDNGGDGRGAVGERERRGINTDRRGAKPLKSLPCGKNIRGVK